MKKTYIIPEIESFHADSCDALMVISKFEKELSADSDAVGLTKEEKSFDWNEEVWNKER